jgi:hypothetical protein
MALEGGFTLAGQDFAMDELAYVAPGPTRLRCSWRRARACCCWAARR